MNQSRKNLTSILCLLPQSPKVRPYSAMDGVPFFLSRVKHEPPEDLLASDLHFHTQTEPVDLSINKPRPSSLSTTLSSSPLRSAFSPSSLSSSSSSSSSPSVITSASSVLTPGPLVAPGTGVRGQPYLHILHSVPPPPSSPLSLQGAGKLASHVHRIPVVVQSLPLMYTTAVRSPSSLNNAIMLPLLDEAKSQGKGETMLSEFTPYSYGWLSLLGFLWNLTVPVRNTVISKVHQQLFKHWTVIWCRDMMMHYQTLYYFLIILLVLHRWGDLMCLQLDTVSTYLETSIRNKWSHWKY